VTQWRPLSRFDYDCGNFFAFEWHRVRSLEAVFVAAMSHVLEYVTFSPKRDAATAVEHDGEAFHFRFLLCRRLTKVVAAQSTPIRISISSA
jgi:hypothetical protein